MVWIQESQYRHQYSTDGKDIMAWQPTSVWQSDPVKLGKVTNPLSAKDWMESLSGLIALMVTFVVCMSVGHIGWVEHLSTPPRWILLGITILASLAGSVAILEMKIIQTLIKAGMFLFCTGYIVLPVIRHLF